MSPLLSHHARLLGSLLLTLAALGTEALGNNPFGETRGLWISRFEYNEDSTSDIQSRINNAADMGITDVYWQVRAKADAYYNSGFESPAQDWQQNIDPLQTALDAAANRGVKVHAWLNTMPIWRDTTQPTDPNHVFFNSDPSFRVTDINGNVEQLVGGSSSFSGSYARINHVLPEVQDHLNDVVTDLTTNYDIDGIHLDYIRWLGPSETDGGTSRPDWDYLPHDDYSHQLYQQATGGDGSAGGSFAQRQSYRDWVQSRVTDLVARVGNTIDAVEVTEGREIELSAAVWNNPTRAENEYLQDYRTWMEQDLLDVAIPMVYLSQSNRNLMQGFLNDIFATPTNTEVSIGLGTYLHDNGNDCNGGQFCGGVEETLAQLQQVYDDGRADNLTFFSYPSLLNGSSLSNQRRTAVLDWYDNLDDLTPDPPAPRSTLASGSSTYSRFEFEGSEDRFGSGIDAAFQTTGIDAGSFTEQTSEVGHYSEGSQRLNIEADGEWTIRHLSGGGSPASNDDFQATGYVGFWLKTETAGLTVQIAVDDPGSADRGLVKDVVADGEWRLYEWDLDDDTQWQGWVTGDGVITGPMLTLDSIFLYGSGDAEVFLDTVAFRPEGSLFSEVLPGDYTGDGLVGQRDYFAWRDAFGKTGTGHAADGNGDGRVDAADYAIWRDAVDAAGQAAVPEPTAALLVAIGLVGVRCLVVRVG